jgi:uncharacterized protein YfaS (alpha-2-macroglobulin family)
VRIGRKFLAAALLAFCATVDGKPLAPAPAPDLELITDGEFLQPSSTIEIRFSRPVVGREAVTGDAGESPIVITPALAGRFVWLSRQTGTYVPNDIPPLGVDYTISTRPDLKAADGTPIGRGFRAIIRTPPFGVSTIHTGGEPDDAAPRPAVQVGFNAAVDLENIEGLFSFVDESGGRIAATVRYAAADDHFNIKSDEDDWDKRWELARHPKAEKNTSAGDEDEEESDAAGNGEQALNQLIVSPVNTLTPGRKWSLEINRGIRSKSGKCQIAQPKTVELGLVKPFVLRAVKPVSYINSGRRLMLEFSRALAPDVGEEKGAKYFHITPAVANLRVEEAWDSLTLSGDFERGRQYRLEVDPSVISQEGLPLEQNQPRTFEFPPVKPRVYLPEITGHQIRAGNRKFELRSINLRSLQITVRRVAPADAPKALDAFRKYDREPSEEEDPDEIYQKLPDGLVHGKVIAEQTIDVADAALDAQQKTTLDWNKIVGPNVAGVIFLTVEGEPLPGITSKRPGAQALIQLTDLGVLWKKLDDGLSVSVFSYANGHGVRGARVSTVGETFRTIETAVTDDAGATALRIPEQSGWLLVQQGDDLHAMRVGESELELPNSLPVTSRDWTAKPNERPLTRAFLFTDRPLYQPGEEIKIKGIVRRAGASGLEADARHRGTLSVTNSRGDQVAEANVETDDRGAFDAAIKLGSAPVGHAVVQLKLANGEDDDTSFGGSCSFEIAAYQANAFELNVAAPKRLGPEEQLRASVSGKYFFGAPLTKAQARWTLRYLRQSFTPAGFWSFHFGRMEEAKENALTLRGDGTLGGTAPFTIAPKLPSPKGVPRKGVLTVEVTDINQQSVSETQEFTHDATDFYIGVAEPSQSVIAVGEEMALRAIAIHGDGEVVQEPVEVKAELIRLRHETVRMQGAGNAITFRTSTIEEKTAEAAGQTLPAEKNASSWRAIGETAKFKPETAGQYRLRVTARDSAGRDVVSESDFYVSGRSEMGWDYRNSAQVELVADKKEYQAGDTAHLLVKTPISGDAMITIERGGSVLRTIRKPIEGNAPTIDVPITGSDAPNIFVSMVVIRGSEASARKFKTPEYRYGVCMLRVGNPVDRLQVSVTPRRREVQPADELETEIGVRDGNGAPVENAEVSFFAVDDGVLALTGYTAPKPGEKFNEPIPLAVKTGLTQFQLMPEDPAELQFENKGYLIGGGGGEGPPMKLRHDFPGTACWMPSLHTDRDGRVRVRFRAPDALTRYRLVAVAHARATMFGSGESAFTIRKPLMLLPAVGQFGNVGDEVLARTVVRNETGTSGTVDVLLELDATAESNQPTKKSVDVPNGEARTVEFPVRFRKTGDAQWKWRAGLAANGAAFEDNVVSVLAVGSPMLTLRETYLGDARESNNDVLAGANPQVLEGTGSVALTVANTRLASLRGSVAHLREYPYGCAEQTISALIPWVVLPQLKPVLPELKDGEEQAAIRTGIEKITSMQTSGGGIAFWPGGQRPSLFASAYTAVALALLKERAAITDKQRDSLCEFLSGELRGMNKVRDETTLGERALALYAVAAFGKAEPSYHEELFRRRAELSRESRALLALAIVESGGPAAMVSELLDVRKPAPEAFSWYGGAARETAIELMAWVRFKPKAPEIARLANELLAFRVNGRWNTTQENAWALMALAQYYTKVERGGGPAQGSLVFGDLHVPFDVTKEQPSKTQSFHFGLPNQLSALRVDNPQKAPLFTDAAFVVHPPVGNQPRQDRGFAVSRSYRKITDGGALEEAANLKVGDRVLVTLRVETSRPARFVAIDDPLPSIFESVNPAFVSRAVGGAEEGDVDYVSDHREMRADRVMIFCDTLPAGAFTFRYLARVRSAGSATAPSTKAEEMYHPERFGLCETMRVSSHSAD